MADKGKNDELKMGRPKIDFDDKDWERISQAASIHCTGDEIAHIMGISYDTLERRVKEKHGMSFADYIKSKSSNGKISLRRMQWKACEAGNPTMLIWLGKQYLQQTDKVDVDQRSSDASMSPKPAITVVFESVDKNADKTS